VSSQAAYRDIALPPDSSQLFTHYSSLSVGCCHAVHDRYARMCGGVAGVPVQAMRIDFPYPGIAPVEVPDANLLGVFAPGTVSPSAPIDRLVAEALAHPIGTPPLRALASSRTRVLIVVDDVTRPTPAAAIIPVILAELQAAGVSNDHLAFLTADGTHGPMSRVELERKLGPTVLERYPVFGHRWRDRGDLVDLGTTSTGFPVVVNRHLRDADLTIAVGHIVPHRITGFSGGAKAIMPGLAGAPTSTEDIHWLAAQYPARSITGVAENPIRAIVDEAGQRSGLRFIVNVIQDNQERVIRVVAGDPVRAHREGCLTARDVYGVSVPARAPIVLLDSFPADLDFWQAAKAVYAAELAVEPGGVVILVTPCPRGVAAEHPELVGLGVPSLAEIRQRVASGLYRDVVAAAIAALTAWVVRERAYGIMVSPGIPPDQQRALGFEPASTARDALTLAFQRLGSGAKVLVLHHGGEILPMLP